MNRITIREVAAAAGVSVGTVSRALNQQPGLSEELRQAVIATADRLGYDRARLRSSAPSGGTAPRRVLFILNRYHRGALSNAFYSRVLQGAESCCRHHKALLSLLMLGPDDGVEQEVRRQRPHLLLCVGHFEESVFERLRRLELPMVAVDHHASGVHCVNDDNFRGAYEVTDHLIAQGHRRIAFIGGPSGHHSIALRARGYRKAMFEAGLPTDPDLEVQVDGSADRTEAVASTLRRLLQLPNRPDALFVYNDELALEVLHECQNLGLRVPHDLAIAGYDDIAAAASSTPGLTTVRVEKELMGFMSTQQLLAGQHTSGETLLPVELVVRGSTVPQGGESAPTE